MSKTNKTFNHRYESDEFEDDYRRANPTRDRRHEKRVTNALRTKNINALIDLEDEDDVGY